MRSNTKAILADFVRVFHLREPVVEVGSLQVEGQEAYGDLRPIFTGRSYIGVDMRSGPGVDRVESFEQRTSFADGEAGTIVTVDTLEHVFDVFGFIREANRVLAPDGLFLAISVMYFPIHSHPYDYWRFTPEAFRRLLEPIGPPLILTQGPADFPHTVVAVVRKGGELTAAEKEAFTAAVANAPDDLAGCPWRHPRETAIERDLAQLRAYHEQWGPVAVSGFRGFDRAEWARDTAGSAFDPNLSRWFYASLCWKDSRWLDTPLRHIPTDLMALQELVVGLRPSLIIETGADGGGSALFFASLLHVLHGDGGRVLTADLGLSEDVRAHIRRHPLGRLVTAIEGDSTAPAVVGRMAAAAAAAQGPVMVFLNSAPAYARARDELRLYSPLVTPGSYLVVSNTICQYLADVPPGRPEWDMDNPLRAVREFLMAHSDFVADRSHEKYMATFAPMGFLRRRAPVALGDWRPNRSTLEAEADGGVRCITYGGADGVWGGMLMGCVRANECDGATLPCTAGRRYCLTFALQGLSDYAGVRLALSVIDEQNRRLNQAEVPLDGSWQPVQLEFQTRPDSRYLGLQIVKAKNAAPAVFHVRDWRVEEV